MAGGVAGLGEDADLLDAFRVANRAVARALRRRLGDPIGPDGPRWRPFQLAFLLLNLPGLADPRDPHRETVDLAVLPDRRRQDRGVPGAGRGGDGAAAPAPSRRRGAGRRGVGVIMRYTLRLLTLDQLARAAGLVCALEMERSEAGGRYGSWPFEIAGPLGTMAGLYETAIEALAVREVGGRVVKPKRSAPLKAYAGEAEARTRLDQFDRDLEQEPGLIRAFYEVQAKRVEPVASCISGRRPTDSFHAQPRVLPRMRAVVRFRRWKSVALPLRAARVKLRAEEMVPTLTLSESVQRGVAAIWSLQETVADDLREALEAAYPLSLDDDLAEQVASTVDTLARSEIKDIVSALSRLSGIASGGYVPLDDLCRGVYETMRNSEDNALVLSESEQAPFRGRLKSLMSTRSIHLWGRARLVFTEHERFEAEFAALAERWLAETAHVSSLSRIVVHPAYQQIIGMGPRCVGADIEMDAGGTSGVLVLGAGDDCQRNAGHGGDGRSDQGDEAGLDCLGRRTRSRLTAPCRLENGPARWAGSRISSINRRKSCAAGRTGWSRDT